MKKFAQFIWNIIGPAIEWLGTATICVAAFIWAFSGFGLIMIALDYSTNSEHFTYVGYSLIAIDVIILALLLYGIIVSAYEKVYKTD